jgi:hypothetical protein
VFEDNGHWPNDRFLPKADIPARDTSSLGANSSPNRQ